MSKKATLGYTQQRQIATNEMCENPSDRFSLGVQSAINKTDIDYMSIRQLKELELGYSDYFAYPEIISLRTVAESMVLSQIPYMWTIQIGNYTNFYGITYEMPYIIGKTPDKGIFYALYTDKVHEYNLTHVNYHNGDTAKRVKGRYNALCKLLKEWKPDIPNLTIYTLLNAYKRFSDLTDSSHRNVSEFSKSCKKAVTSQVKAHDRYLDVRKCGIYDFYAKIDAIEYGYYRRYIERKQA